MSLANTYRPNDWKEVVGQKAAVKAFSRLIEDRDQQCFLLTGPSGVGKTTLARIAAHHLDAVRVDLDGAKFSSVEDVRDLRDRMMFRPMDGKNVAIIADECHRFSGAAWDCMLSVTEEPPEWVYWFMCTTLPSKVPRTMKTRATTFALKLLTDSELATIADEVRDAEKIKISADVRDLCIRQAEGSARQLMMNLDMCRHAKDRREAADLLRTASGQDQNPSLELFRLINSNARWPDLMAAVDKLTDPPESIRYSAIGYFGACVKNAKSDGDAVKFLTKMEAFSQPYAPEEGIAALVRSIGRAVLS